MCFEVCNVKDEALRFTLCVLQPHSAAVSADVLSAVPRKSPKSQLPLVLMPGIDCNHLAQ